MASSSPTPTPTPPPSHPAPLPQECLESVIAYLRYDLPSLHALLLVSRQFFQLTVPVLYRSPFRLATALRDPPHWASRSFATLYRSEASMDQSHGRIKRLTRLLIQNLGIPPPGQHRPPPPSPSILDDSSGMENLQPLIPPFVDQPSTWLRKPDHRSEDAEVMWPPFNPNDTFSNKIQDTGLSSSTGIHLEPGADLISFDSDCEADNKKGQTTKTLMSRRNQQSTDSSSSESSESSESSSRHVSGLLMDYFYFYSDHDHRRIRAVIRQIYPGAGRRVYDKYLSDIELAILQHNPSKVESLYIHDVIPVVPHLIAHLASFSKISSIDLHDAVWTHEELKLVHQFLVKYAIMFPAAGSLSPEENTLQNQGQLRTRLGHSAYRNPAIRRLKYQSSRGHCDGACINGQEFDPIQLLLALGPGVEIVDIVHWATTTLSQLDSLDAGALISLRLTPLMTLYEDATFSRPEFLSRCRRLRLLDLFSSSRDMFGWAVKEWDREHRHGSLTLGSPTTQQVHLPLVQMKHLRVRGPRDSVMYDIIRDALYAFRDSLQTLHIYSDLAHMGEPEWMDRIGTFITGKMFAQQRKEQEQQKQEKIDGGDRPPMPKDYESYREMSSIDAGPLLIQWQVSCLSTLELTGPIATELDLESLMFMPNLKILHLSISKAPAAPRMGNRAGKTPSNLTYLPYVTGPRLQRVILRGPWRELTDETLWEMICPDVDFPSSQPLSGPDHLDNDDDDDNNGPIDEDGIETETEHHQCGEWAGQLLELTILENPRVTVPGMIQLARRMERLEVMGTDLNMKSSSGDQWHSRSSNKRINSMSNHFGLDPESQARRLLLKISVKLPWLDIGPDANHLGRSPRRQTC